MLGVDGRAHSSESIRRVTGEQPGPRERLRTAPAVSEGGDRASDFPDLRGRGQRVLSISFILCLRPAPPSNLACLEKYVPSPREVLAAVPRHRHPGVGGERRLFLRTTPSCCPEGPCLQGRGGSWGQ